MARKSRKYPNIDLIIKPSRDTVGYIRLSVLNKDSFSSIESQKLIIEEWGEPNEIIISHYYIDNGFSGKRFDRPAFQEMLQDIRKGKIDCVVVKDLLLLTPIRYLGLRELRISTVLNARIMLTVLLISS